MINDKVKKYNIITGGKMKLIGSFICPHKEGDYILTVTDLYNFFTGHCCIEQNSKHEKHAIILSKSEAIDLAKILMKFGGSKDE